jgi:hypothetical protein
MMQNRQPQTGRNGHWPDRQGGLVRSIFGRISGAASRKGDKLANRAALKLSVRRTDYVPTSATAKKLSGCNEASGKFFSRRWRLALTPAQWFTAKPKIPCACGSVTNASSYGDSYEDAFCVCVWRFYGVYVFFRKAYCYKLWVVSNEL